MSNNSNDSALNQSILSKNLVLQAQIQSELVGPANFVECTQSQDNVSQEPKAESSFSQIDENENEDVTPSNSKIIVEVVQSNQNSGKMSEARSGTIEIIEAG